MNGIAGSLLTEFVSFFFFFFFVVVLKEQARTLANRILVLVAHASSARETRLARDTTKLSTESARPKMSCAIILHTGEKRERKNPALRHKPKSCERGSISNKQEKSATKPLMPMTRGDLVFAGIFNCCRNGSVDGASTKKSKQKKGQKAHK